jgi:hypothetical protein
VIATFSISNVEKKKTLLTEVFNYAGFHFRVVLWFGGASK